MNSPRILVLGGYGNAGFSIAKLLLQESRVRLTLAGRNTNEAAESCRLLNDIFPGNRAGALFADAADPASLKRALKDMDLIIVASSTAVFTRQVVQAALDAGTDYFDIQYSCEKIRVLNSYADRIKKAGCCFITEAGFHPGLPAVLIRYGAQFFDSIRNVFAGSLIRFNWKSVSFSEATKQEFVHGLLEYNPTHFKNGKWNKAGIWKKSDYRTMDMGSPFGKKYCVPMFLEELRQLPEAMPSLENMGFYIAGFHWFVDMFIFPVIVTMLKIFGERAIKSMAGLLYWSLRKTSAPPYRTIVKLEAYGKKDGQNKSLTVHLSHEDSYLFTAIPAVACLLQYLDGSIRKPGLWCMGMLADPVRLVADMKRMGIDIAINGEFRVLPQTLNPVTRHEV